VEKTCQTLAIMNNGKILVKDSIRSIIEDDETLEDVFIRYLS
jgi:ABC-type methionine transport system ATPase subunit